MVVPAACGQDARNGRSDSNDDCLRFMVYLYQSLALVGEPAIGVLRYGKTVR